MMAVLLVGLVFTGLLIGYVIRGVLDNVLIRLGKTLTDDPSQKGYPSLPPSAYSPPSMTLTPSWAR